MKPNVPFQDFCHQTIYSATAGDGKVQGFDAVCFFLQELFKGVDLTTKPTHAQQKLLLVSNGVGHRVRTYHKGVWYGSQRNGNNTFTLPRMIIVSNSATVPSTQVVLQKHC
jgi:hypothetical protein